MSFTTNNLLAKSTNRTGFNELINSGHSTIHDSTRVSDHSPTHPDNGIRHDIPVLHRQTTDENEYFASKFTVNGSLGKDEWCEQFEDVMAVGLTILHHMKYFSEGESDYFFEIISETTEESFDYSDEDDESENEDDFLETSTHLFRITSRKDGVLVLEHGQNEVDPEYGVIEIPSNWNPEEFIELNCYPFA